MNDNTEGAFDITSALDTWMKSYNDLWGNMANQWETILGQSPAEKKGHVNISTMQSGMAALLKNWQSITTAMSTPESADALFKGSSAFPEVLLKLAQTSVGSFAEMQQNIFQRLGRIGDSVKAYEFQDIDENIFRMWTDIYEKEFRQFLQVPQLGLLRGYQEKICQTIDKFNLFQANLSEFLRMLGLPFNHSLQVMQEKMSKMAEEGKLSEDIQAHYRMWIKVLEGHFMTLFQTPEYVEVLARTINSLADFSAAKDAVFEDMLMAFPVAKKTEVDEMGRELYELKKRLRRLEQQSDR
ncbi:poly(R)-hydroxyalkanoic acid synthase subunit PhaE [Desulfosarcina ovata]|uniref:Poly(3-hydroxyalkanoate) polymerase subunit PhaE n=1 Tax=Desulfosarcina ovata subsp. ovata TaxID=2752305 RepID=A0A5K8A420_9BACT|nr:poly(R)-hydroxyalkanoic acid synthase subunit PhaE [Desulfosarcina ovata]BBO87158.1 hypothetical protein DSCOOX_03380 [Desulfosarcina ovata subsp. ovata]